MTQDRFDIVRLCGLVKIYTQKNKFLAAPLQLSILLNDCKHALHIARHSPVVGPYLQIGYHANDIWFGQVCTVHLPLSDDNYYACSQL